MLYHTLTHGSDDDCLYSIEKNNKEIENICGTKPTALSELHGGDTILLHDAYKETADAIKIILPELIQAGYQMVTISEFT